LHLPSPTHHSFPSLLPPPPTPPLFPYTTLFRSDRSHARRGWRTARWRSTARTRSIRWRLPPNAWSWSDRTRPRDQPRARTRPCRSEEHTSELQSPYDLVCRLLLEKKKKKKNNHI